MLERPSLHIEWYEYRCRCGCQHLPPDFFDGDEIRAEYVLLFSQFEKIREIYARPIPITSGYRCEENQLELFRKGVSSTPYSVHMFGLALDLQPPAEDIPGIMKTIKIAAPTLRVGWKAYRNYAEPIIHIDVGWVVLPRWSADLVRGAEW